MMAFFLFLLLVSNSLAFVYLFSKFPIVLSPGPNSHLLIFSKPSAVSLYVIIVMLSTVMVMLLMCSLRIKVKVRADKVMKVNASVGKKKK